jgi:DNA-binding XRE family transcriptional regulator
MTRNGGAGVSTKRNDLDAFVEEQNQDPAFAAAFQDAQARAALLATCVRVRKDASLTQAEVALAMRTTQSAISDLESGATDPRLSTLQRYARAVGVRLDLALLHPSAAV